MTEEERKAAEAWGMMDDGLENIVKVCLLVLLWYLKVLMMRRRKGRGGRRRMRRRLR